VLLKGNIAFCDINRIKNAFGVFEDAGLLSNFQNETQEIPGFNTSASTLDLIKISLDLVPTSPLFTLKLKNDKSFMLPLKENFIRYPTDIISQFYGSRLAGIWSVLGIYNAASRSSNTETIWEIMTETYQTTIDSLSLPSNVIIPILIYRPLEIAARQQGTNG
jgi:hypothetical protein